MPNPGRVDAGFVEMTTGVGAVIKFAKAWRRKRDKGRFLHEQDYSLDDGLRGRRKET